MEGAEFVFRKQGGTNIFFPLTIYTSKGGTRKNGNWPSQINGPPSR